MDIMQSEVFTEASADVVDGLSRRPRTLPSKYFYDQRGSELFDEICRTPEYYVTRTEVGLLSKQADDIANALGPRVHLVELGSGSSVKTRILLDALDRPSSYVPVDISAEHLEGAAGRLASEYPQIRVVPAVADFTQPLQIPVDEAAARTIVFFPGSSIGNFGPREILSLLRHVVDLIGRDGGFLIGIDLVKSRDVLNAAYNDATGITARFNLNMLAHLNEVAAASFVLEDFRHRAYFNEEESRIEMHLVSARDTVVEVEDQQFEIREGESIRTEVSYKFTVEGFARLAAGAGLHLTRSWSDERDWFSILLFEFDHRE